ncbi:hypothetical protein QTN25_010847 [Entamoeba marina]
MVNFITSDFSCSKCADWCVASSDNNQIKCTYYVFNCYVNPEENNGCYRLDSDGITCLQCDIHYTLDSGECYTYSIANGYDGIDYNCTQYIYNDTLNSYPYFETFSPNNNFCENPYTLKESSSSETTVDSSSNPTSNSSSETNPTSSSNSETTYDSSNNSISSSNSETNQDSSTNEGSDNNNDDDEDKSKKSYYSWNIFNSTSVTLVINSNNALIVLWLT